MNIQSGGAQRYLISGLLIWGTVVIPPWCSYRPATVESVPEDSETGLMNNSLADNKLTTSLEDSSWEDDTKTLKLLNQVETDEAASQ